MNRTEKTESVAEIGQIFQESGAVVVARYAGLTVAQITDLRRRMAPSGASFKVIKNRLAKIALANAGITSGHDMFLQPTGIAYARDPVAAAKVATEYAKANDKFVIIGGLVGKSVMSEEGVRTLARLPSLNELRAQLCGVLNAPATKLARTLNEPGSSLARVLDAYVKKQSEPAPAEAAEEPVAA